MPRTKQYLFDCPQCGESDRTRRKGIYKRTGEYRIKCDRCGISFIRPLPNQQLPDRPPLQINQGDRHPQSKITDDDARAIVSQVRSGQPKSEIAELYNISISLINSILSGRVRSRQTGIAPAQLPKSDRTPKPRR